MLHRLDKKEDWLTILRGSWMFSNYTFKETTAVSLMIAEALST